MQNSNKKFPIKFLFIPILIGIVIIFIYFSIFPFINEENLPSEDFSSSLFSQIENSSSFEISSQIESEAPPKDPEILPEMAKLHKENPDIFGWIKIENTNIDYPVMFTPDDEERYLYADFNGNYDIDGLPFIDKDCKADPESKNIIIYGHNMLDGTMFQNLLKYENEDFWKEHPIIEFKTLYENRKYEIIGAFRDRVYYKYETCFKFYQFIDPSAEEFNEAIDYYIQNTPYDMNVSANYDDNLITLVTCAYHHEHGRYVVVAREIKD